MFFFFFVLLAGMCSQTLIDTNKRSLGFQKDIARSGPISFAQTAENMVRNALYKNQPGFNKRIYFNRTCDLLVSINSRCILLFLFFQKEHGRFEVLKNKIDFVGLSLAWEMACMEMTVMVVVPNVVVGSKLSNPQFHYCNHINFLSHKKSILASFMHFPHILLG